MKDLYSKQDIVPKAVSLKERQDNLIKLKYLLAIISPLILAIIGSAARGDLMSYILLLWKNWRNFHSVIRNKNASDFNFARNRTFADNLENVHWYVLSSIISSFVMFYGLGGYLQWYYYVLQRNRPKEWKCQPERFLTKENERHEILSGSRNMLIGSVISGILTTFAMNEAAVFTFYYNVDERGWFYLIVSTLLVFLYQDGAAYYAHRYFHVPWFYKLIHKHHHRYHSPTAFGAVAMHPVEFTILQVLLVIPIFVVPIYFASFLWCVMYVYYYGMIDHSGIDMEAIWPWQPPVRFHDDHHKYFHVNFGFNTLIFDRFHDTLRKRSRTYGENIFGGRGVETEKPGNN